jgi:hypothetical protein
MARAHHGRRRLFAAATAHPAILIHIKYTVDNPQAYVFTAGLARPALVQDKEAAL